VKNKTNRQVLNKAIKDLNEIEVAFMRVQLLQAIDDVLNNEDEVRKEMKNSIINVNLWIGTMRSIKDKIDF
jgi:flagellar biosynthesis regulator FlaF